MMTPEKRSGLRAPTRLATLFLMLLTWLPAAWAIDAPTATLPAGVHFVQLVEGVYAYRLDNGLEILLSPDDTHARTTVHMTYHTGSADEGPGEAGMAHLLEHMLFRANPAHPDAMAEFARRGLAANGSTSADQTSYYATFRSDPPTLAWYLDWQRDAMAHAQLRRDDLDAEMTVVRNELERGENSPFGVLLRQVSAAAYEWHPYGRSVIGTRSDLEHVQIDALRAFYHQHYRPDNATLILTGAFDPPAALEMIAKRFGPLPKPDQPPARLATREPVQQGARAVTLRRTGGSPVAIVQYHLPQASADAFTALSLGIDMLADNPAGPLYQALVENGAASSLFGSARAMRDPGYALLGVMVPAEGAVSQVLDQLTGLLEDPNRAPLGEAALTRTRTAWLHDWQRTYDQPERLAQALASAATLGDWRLFFIERERVKALTLDDVNTQLHAWLISTNRTSGRYLPTADPHYAPSPPATALDPWLEALTTGTRRAAAPFFDTRPQALDEATQRSTLTLPNGPVRLALLPKASSGQQVFAELRLHGGTLQQLQGLTLEPDLVASLLTYGARDLDRQAIDDQLNQLNSDLSFSSDGNVLRLRLRSVRDHFPQALALALHLMREPAFPPQEFEKLRRRLRVSLENQKASPAYLARKALARHDQPWSPEDYRYSATPEETRQRLDALTRDDLVDFHAQFYGAGNLSLAVVGDFDPDTLRATLKEGLAGWRQAPAYARIPEPWYPMSPIVMRIATPGKANADLLATVPLKLQDTDPMWPALTLANYLLGGSEDSRLWRTVRARDGLSYSVGSSLQASAWEPSATWSFFASAAAHNADALLAAVRSVIGEAREQGFSQAEVDAGIQSLTRYLELGRSNDRYLTGRWADYLETGRSFAWQQQFADRLQALRADDVNAALRAVLDPDDLTIAIAADPDSPAGEAAP